jgi:3-oxoadipate enol-lactonase
MLLHHEVTGAGPPILLLHAGVCDLRMWQAQREDLATDHTIVATDLRGYGQSPLPGGAYSDARDVLALLDHLGLERVGVVGASRGGAVALQVASAAPDRVSRLVLLAPAAEGVAPTPDVEEFAAAEDTLLERGEVDAATDLNVRTWLGPDADDRARESVREMQRHAFDVQLAVGDDVVAEDLVVDLGRISARTLVVSGEHDLEFFQAIARHLEAHLPDVRHVVLPWAGHLPSLERPAETTALIRTGLAA